MGLPPLALRLALTGALGLAALLLRGRGGDQGAAALAAAALVAAIAPPRVAPLLVLAGLALASVIAITMLWPDIAGHAFALLPALGMLAFAWHFGATLRPGQEPLILHYIRRDFGSLPEECAPYGRALTVFWTATFLGFALLNLAPALGVLPAPVAGGATLLASLLFFLGEHAVRARRFPDRPVAVSRTLRAMWLSARAPHA